MSLKDRIKRARAEIDNLRTLLDDMLRVSDLIDRLGEAGEPAPVDETDETPEPGPPPSLDAVWVLYKRHAPPGGLSPHALFAIFQWETGQGRSKLWKIGHNPGGMKYHPELEGLGHRYGSYRARDGNIYAKFPDVETGIKAHVAFLLQQRYALARNAAPKEAVLAIHNAGYAEGSEDWLKGVTGLAIKAVEERGP